MARDSRRKRRDRKLRRERSLAYRMAETAVGERNQARLMVKYLIDQVDKRDNPEVATNDTNDQTDRPDPDSTGLEVSEK